jgi:hypothetical protein
LPVIRIASASCGKDWREHRKIAEALHGPKGWGPAVAETFRQFDRVRAHLQALVKMIGSAEARWLLSCAYIAPPPKELKKAKS